jgi:hypothetical protein
MGRGGDETEALRLPQRRGLRQGARRWTEAALEAELRAWLGERNTWPTRRELQAAGRFDLVSAISAYGGAAYWARRLGVPLRAAQDRRRRTQAELVAEARELIAELGRLPNADALARMGHSHLGGLVRRHGGAAAFCRRHGLGS